MKNKGLIPCKIVHDVSAPRTDIINGQWHKGHRREGSETVAFKLNGQWWASNPAKTKCFPCASQAQALAA